MSFQTVPPIDSSEYINSQKADFETEYYVDNLNALGAGGGGGGSEVVYVGKITSPVTANPSGVLDFTCAVYACGVSASGYATLGIADAGTYVIDIQFDNVQEMNGVLGSSASITTSCNSGGGWTTQSSFPRDFAASEQDAVRFRSVWNTAANSNFQMTLQGGAGNVQANACAASPQTIVITKIA